MRKSDNPFTGKSPGSQSTLDLTVPPNGAAFTSGPVSRYKFVPFRKVIPEGPTVPLSPVAPGGPCGPCAPVAPLVPLTPGGPCGPTLVSLWSFLLSSNLICLQNSTELTKNPSKGPVLHSYFLSSVGYWL